MSTAKIALFDSGLGGLTVLRALLNEMPDESYVYFGDTARVPYGNKSQSVITRYALEIAHFLLEQDVKLLIVACNSASALALETLRREVPIPVLGVIQAAVDDALRQSPRQKIAILGTRATISSGAYQEAIARRCRDAEVHASACPLFVPLVEEGMIDHPASHLVAEEYLDPLRDKGVDSAIMACTHYPLLKNLIQTCLGPQVQLIDCAQSVARQAHDLLKSADILSSDGQGMVQFYASDDPEKFSALGQDFLQRPIPHTNLQTLDSFHHQTVAHES